MTRVTQLMRARVEMQGFVGLPDESIRDINYWLRVAPLASGAWTAAGVVLGSAALVWALVPVAVLGAVLPRSPFDAIYMHAVRPLRRTAPIPVSAAPRRFAWGLVSVWLAGVGACFSADAIPAGRLLGGALLVVMTVQVLSGLSLPSALYGSIRRSSILPGLQASDRGVGCENR